MTSTRTRVQSPTPHRDKICKTCGRAVPWRKKRTHHRDAVQSCSDACHARQPAASGQALEAAILSLLAERNPSGGHAKTICPSEAAKSVGGAQSRHAWEPLMKPARAAARRLVAQRKLVITQHNQIVDPATAKGPIRLRLP